MIRPAPIRSPERTAAGRQTKSSTLNSPVGVAVGRGVHFLPQQLKGDEVQDVQLAVAVDVGGATELAGMNVDNLQPAIACGDKSELVSHDHTTCES